MCLCLHYTIQCGLTIDNLGQKLITEVESSKEKYSLYCLDTPDVVKATKEYIHKKKYMSEITDLLIEALAQALSLKINIITKDPSGHTSVITISPHSQCERIRAELYLLRSK